MSVVISLRDIVNEMAELSDRQTAYLNRVTGEIVTMNERTRSLLEAAASDDQLGEQQRELRALMDAGDLVELPGKYEQKLFTIVEQFCETVREQESRETLAAALRTRQAFREFKKAVRRLGLQDRWAGFRNTAFENLAIDWLDANGLEYRRAA